MISIYDVLKASKGIHVDDTFANLWGRKLSNAYTVATYTGTLPATLRTVRGYLVSYKIYGNAIQAGTPTPENPIVPSECGERTGNLFDKDATLDGYWLSSATGVAGPQSGYSVSDYIRTNEGESYTNVEAGKTFCWYDENKSFIRTTTQATTASAPTGAAYFRVNLYTGNKGIAMVVAGSTAPTEYIPYGYKLPLAVNGVEYPIYIGNEQLAKDEYVDSSTGKIYRRTKNLSPPEEEWVDEWVWGDGTVHPSTQIKTSPFIDVSTCETCIMEVFSAETEWAAAGYRAVAFYDANKQYLGWIGGGGRQTLTPNSTERLSEFPVGTVYVRIGCSHDNQPFYPQLVSGYTPTHQFYPYLVPTDPPAPFPQIPTTANSTTISWGGQGLAPSEVELTYRKPKGQ